MVERWLQQLEHQMIVSLQDVASEACAAYLISKREEWVLVWPGQIVQSGSCVHYTAEVTLIICLEGYICIRLYMDDYPRNLGIRKRKRITS